MARQEQVDRIIEYHKQLSKQHKGYELFDKYSTAIKVYNLYFSGKKTQYEVSRAYEGIQDKRKKKVLPIVNYYTQALVEINWLNVQKHEKLVTRNKKTYHLLMDCYFATLEPFFEYLKSNRGKTLLTASGKNFLESFFNRKYTREFAVEGDKNFIFGAIELFRQYIVFKQMFYVIEMTHGKVDLNFVLDKYSGKEELVKDLFSEFLGIYINERSFWKTEKEYTHWWDNFQKFLFENYADIPQFQKIIRTKILGGGSK